MQTLLQNGWQIFKMFWRATDRFPELLIPLLAGLSLFVPPVLALEMTGVFYRASIFLKVLALLTMGLVLAVSIGIALVVLLEVIRQVETEKRIRIVQAFRVLPNCRPERVVPVALMVAMAWILAPLIAVLPVKPDDDATDAGMPPTAGSYNSRRNILTAWRRFLFASQGEGLQLALFLILPAIIWQGYDLRQALHRARELMTRHQGFAASGPLAHGGLSTLLLTPFLVVMPLIVLGLLPLPATFVAILLMYACFAWSFAFYIEQMFGGTLYLWHLSWERQAPNAGESEFALDDIPPPVLLQKSRHNPRENKKPKAS